MTALIDAINSRDIIAARQAIEQGDSIFEYDEGGYAAIHHAASCADPAFVLLLSEQPGFNADYINSFTRPAFELMRLAPIHIASGLVHLATARALSELPGCDKSLRTPLGKTASDFLTYEIARLEGEATAQSKQKTPSLQYSRAARALDDAVTSDRVQEASAILTAHPSLATTKDRFNSPPLCHVASLGSLRMMNLFIARGAKINDHDPDPRNAPLLGTPLLCAISTCKLDKVQRLLELDAVLDGALVAAASQSNTDILRTIIQAHLTRGDDIAPLLNKAILKALFSHNGIERTTMLLEFGADIHSVNEGGKSLLQRAATAPQWASIRWINFLVANHADIHRRDEQGNTLLHLAVTKHPSIAWESAEQENSFASQVCTRLLELGVDAGAVNDRGQTAADIAKENQKPFSMKVLQAGRVSAAPMLTPMYEEAPVAVAAATQTAALRPAP